MLKTTGSETLCPHKFDHLRLESLSRNAVPSGARCDLRLIRKYVASTILSRLLSSECGSAKKGAGRAGNDMDRGRLTLAASRRLRGS